MIRIIVDSASDVSEVEAKALGITMLPLLVTIDGEDYYDGVNLTPSEFYEKLIESDALPKTSQITPYRFSEEFEKVVSAGDEAIVITLSSKLSGTNEAARQASEKFGGKIRVIDSLSASVGERLLVEFALSLIKSGKSLSEIEKALNEKKEKLTVMAVIDTLEYLKKGGRISSVVAFAGELISLKPVVALVDGEVKLVGKALGSKRGNNQLNKLVEKSNGIDFSMPFGTIYSGLSEITLDKYIRDSAHLWLEHTAEVPRYQIGATIGTHVGPGAVGVAFFANKD